MKYIDLKEVKIKSITTLLLKGGVIVCPTDTIYGLSCSAKDKKAVKRIFKIKARPRGMSLIVLVNSLAMAKKYARIGKTQEKYLRTVWPGPVTVILDSKHKLDEGAEGKDGSIAIRLPKKEFINTIIDGVGVPLVSTSVNRSGEPVLLTPADIRRYFRTKRMKPDILVDAGIAKRKRPSKLVDVRNNKILVIRK